MKNIDDGICFWDWFHMVPVVGQQAACAAVGITWSTDENNVRAQFDDIFFVDAEGEELVDQNAQEEFVAICNDFLEERRWA